jgi:hypothetical protein
MKLRVKQMEIWDHRATDFEAQYLIGIALARLCEDIQNISAEEWAKKYGTVGTEALARYSEPSK